MNDEEEFSYTGYSPDTEAEISDNEATFTDTYDTDKYGEPDEDEERAGGYTDTIISEFSAASTITRVTKITRLSPDLVSYFIAAVYFVIGVLCVAITNKVMLALPYIVGIMMFTIGTVQFILALVHREYRDVKTNKTATALIAAALGIMIIIQELDEGNNSAIMLISVVWGILGLFDAAHAFNHVLSRISHGERCVFYILKGLVELVVAFYLLYKPDSHEAHFYHILVFGINLIFDSITMLPPVKKFMARK